MQSDPLSPFAPTRVRALVLPVGRIKRSRFLHFYQRLKETSAVRLQDFPQNEESPTGESASTAWRLGMVFYDFTLSATPESHVNLSPFELFRESLVVIGIADAQEYVAQTNGDSDKAAAFRKDEFIGYADSLRNQYPRVLVHRLLVFDEPGLESEMVVGQDLIVLPSHEAQTGSILQRLVHNVTVDVRRELGSYSKSIVELSSIAAPTVPQGQGSQPHWPGSEPPSLNRNDSSTSDSSTTPPPTRDQKDMHRMSMPVFSSTHNFSDPVLRADSPSSGRSPARTFEEIGSPDSSMAKNNPIDRLRPRTGSVISSREGSRDRVSVHGFGSDSFSEKSRNKGRGRVEVVMASIYLMAGQWENALNQSVESALKARSSSDYIWYAKSLEHIATTMLLLAWSGMEFQIPSVCYSQMEQVSNDKTNNLTEAEPRNEIILRPFTSRQAQTTMMKMLTSIMLSMTNMVQSIYGRAASPVSGDVVPHIVFSECTIRLSKLLTIINLCGGVLTESGISHLIIGSPLNSSSDLSLSRVRVYPSRREITNTLGRALPGPIERAGLSQVDNALILSGVASVFSLMGMERKKAMIMKEFLDAIVPSLVQAKMVGAAEAGIHPSAATSALSRAFDIPVWDLESGIEDFLNVMCRVYGIPEANWTQSLGSELLNGDVTNSTETEAKPKHLPEQLVGNFVLRSFGNVKLKADVLRACIRLCEVLPDYHGILHYSSTLLRTAGPGIAPNAETSEVLVRLPREEQSHLADNIFKTVADAQVAGLDNVEAEYWDEFLVRGFYLLDSSTSLALRPHRRSTLGKIKSKAMQKRDPFIHNPFLDKAAAQAPANLLAAGEDREYVVSLQNPYDFEVEVEHLKLSADGVDLDITKHAFILKPYRTQSFSLTGNISSHGLIDVSGCIIKIKGCRERLFPIFRDSWTPESETRIKSIGLLKSQRPVSHVSNRSATMRGSELQKRSFPIPATVPLQVIPEQPNLVISGSSLPQNSLMLLEGERTTVSVTVQNITPTIAADFLHVSFRDTASDAMQDVMSQKGIPPADMYEIEYQLTKLSAITLHNDQPTSIPPNSSATFTFDILAKAGLTSAIIQFDYANLMTPHNEVGESFFTRQVIHPIAVTVNASLVVHRLEVVPLSGDFAWHMATRKHETSFVNGNGFAKGHHFKSMAGAFKTTQESEEHCLLLLDLRNNWPSPMTSRIQSQALRARTDEPNSKDDTLSTSSELIQPGQISRHIFLIPKIFVAEPHRRIMPISPAHQRQFVVSTDRITPETERTARECFWFREALLHQLTGSWSLEGDSAPRTGFIDLRSIRLSARMVDTLRLPDIGVSFASEGEAVKQLGRARFQTPVDEYFTVRTTVRNRSAHKIFPLLRLRPCLADQPREVALEVGKRFAWSGVLQRPLPALLPGQEYTVDLPSRALSAGEFEIGASVEEIKAAEKVVNEDDDEPVLDDLITGTGRRTWTAPEACRIIAIGAD